MFLHPGQHNQAVCQLCQAFCLRLDIAEPFIFPNAHLQHLGVPIDNRRRRFQLMAGVSDKLFLFLVAL